MDTPTAGRPLSADDRRPVQPDGHDDDDGHEQHAQRPGPNDGRQDF